jgi:hypothetical protein
MPQRKQGMGVCAVMVISFPPDVFIIALFIDIILWRLIMSFFNRACPEYYEILRPDLSGLRMTRGEGFRASAHTLRMT